MSLANGFLAILWKDLISELRSKEVLTATIVFALLVVIIFHFAFPDAVKFSAVDLAPGCLWVAFTFAGMLALNRAFAQEKDGQRLAGMMLAPIDRSTIFLAKWAGCFIFLSITEAVVFPVFVVLYDLSLGPALPRLVLIFALGTLGFTAVGTLFSAVSANTRMRDVMLPVLLLPVAFPLLTAAVEATSLVLIPANRIRRGDGSA